MMNNKENVDKMISKNSIFYEDDVYLLEDYFWRVGRGYLG